MKAYGGVKRSSTHLSLSPAERRVVNITLRPLCPQERTPIPNELEAGWASELVWTFGRREKSVAPNGIRTPDRTIRNLVTVLTELSRLVLSPVYFKYVVRELQNYAQPPCLYMPNQTVFRTQCTGTFTVCPRGSRLHTLCSGVSLVNSKAKENGSYRKYSHGRHVIILRLRYLVTGS